METSVYEAARSGDLGFLEKSGDCEHLLLQKTPRNNNILHLAAEFGQIDFFKGVLIHSQSPQFWATNNKGDTPMHVAARAGCDEIVGLLINQARKLGADEEGALADGETYKELLWTKNSIGDTALHVAIRQGDLEAVTLLVEADSGLCCLTNIANESPLFLAISKGFGSIALYMLDNSPMSHSFEGINGVTALHAAVTRTNYEGIVQMMVSKNPEIIKEVDANGWTPLHYATLRGNVGAIRLLMQQDSSISYILDKSGMSALHVAAYAGRPKVMEELTQWRPDTCELVKDKGQTVLHAAVLGDQFDVISYIMDTPKFAGLINEADNDGNTHLHLAASRSNPNVLIALAKNPRVDSTAINSQLLKAADIFLGDDIELSAFSGLPVSRLLGRAVGVPVFQQQIRREFMKLESPEENDTPNSTLVIAKKRALEAYWDDSNKFNTDLVVPMLIATVTFAAAFTMPGGFKSNGMAVLYRRAFFGVFVVCDAISFFLSIIMVYNHFRLSAFSRVILTTPSSFIQYSIGGMVVSFSSGMFLVAEILNKRQVQFRQWLRSRII